ncbi:MAG: transglycosylase domain-containing protein [Hyphomicrobiaceae bacterium]|nr:transglycosylase domain-containing protein [Hyphomicrobiaceae bacterium]MCC0010916.1 transglycosylase domain-containing protein [Hyphomicrobiaceae bacterium]
MLAFFRLITWLIELFVTLPVRAFRFVTDWVAFNPRLGPLRHVASAAMLFVLFALVLVYVVAPIRGYAGSTYMADKIRYDAERWLATAIYDRHGSFVGTFDPRLDSQRDVNYTDVAIGVGGYTANPDHKSIPVRDVPEYYWRCLVYHEDRHIGGILNPFGIDLIGVLKIPYSTLKRSVALGRPSFGVGGSTLPMQLSRVIYKTPPRSDEGTFEKLRRKFSEWWLAPVIYQALTEGGDNTPLKAWAANHLWLAQRTGGSPLHGVEVTSRIVFGKEAKDLSIAEQFVLASAINKPIILLEGSERLNEVRLDRWRYIAEVRARTCAEKLIDDAEGQKQVLFDLVKLAGGPPDPHVKPRLQHALDVFAPQYARRAQANPTIRANVLLPAARFGLREEMKQRYGFAWRDYVRGVTTTFDAAENLAFHSKVETALATLDAKLSAKMTPGYTLDPIKAGISGQMPNIILVAADHNGEIVRYFETGETAAYFGSITARDTATGLYDSTREARMIASTGKMLAAIAIANQLKDTPNSLYLDTDAPAAGLETCRHGGGKRHGRKAIVAFACSLNNPVGHRTARVGQARVKALIDQFGFTMPPAGPNGEGTPPSTAAVLGQISGAPRRVHQMSAVILADLLGRRSQHVGEPTLIKSYDQTERVLPENIAALLPHQLRPREAIVRGANGLIGELLSAPLCYSAYKTPHGTLKSLSNWCAKRNAGVRLHFAKTGTQVTEDPDASIDAWVTGGLQFKNGAAYSYVVLVGTGSVREPFARKLHGADIVPLVEVLLQDLELHSKHHDQPGLLPRPRLQHVSSFRSGDSSRAAKMVSSGGRKSLRRNSPADLVQRALANY